ncbi:hypothetical protein BGX27_003616 [Mortierella sp. AM989]|nr:hypothetical protein BGX27_003616 [Mortierella sp. AM989]
MSSFRTMVYIAIFRPLLTAFLGLEGQQGYCSNRLLSDGGPIISRHPLSSRPSLMVVSVPAIQWLVSLITALADDIGDLGMKTTLLPCYGGQDSAASLEGRSTLLALEGFQKETSMLFSSLLQCLIGCFDLINSSWLDLTRTRLGDKNLREDDIGRITDDNKVSIRALHLFGQVLQAIEAVAKVARMIQLEHRSFYQFMAEDRIPGAQDTVSMEASFQEFLSGHTQFTQFERQVYRELQNLSTTESWLGDVLTSDSSEAEMRDDEATMAAGTTQQRQQTSPSILGLIMGWESFDIDGKEIGAPAEGVGPKNAFWLNPGRFALFPAAACNLMSNAFSASALNTKEDRVEYIEIA